MLPVTTATSSVLFNYIFRALPTIRPSFILSKRFQSSSDCDEEIDEGDKPNRIKIDFEKFVPPKEPEPFRSMWHYPKCCIPTCENYRHDIIYLKEGKKKYTRTWAECPDAVQEQYVCSGEILEPEREMRPRRAHTKAGSRLPCDGDEFKLDLMVCKPPPKLIGPCRRIIMPGCDLSRVPPQCKVAVFNKCCQKRCTLYPSYSECKRPKPKVERPIECLCLKIPANCEVFDQYRKFPLK